MKKEEKNAFNAQKVTYFALNTHTHTPERTSNGACLFHRPTRPTSRHPQQQPPPLPSPPTPLPPGSVCVNNKNIDKIRSPPPPPPSSIRDWIKSIRKLQMIVDYYDRNFNRDEEKIINRGGEKNVSMCDI